jgi:hypothetical protein
LKLKTIYPPKFKWIVESKAIHDRWDYYIEEGPQPDKRETRHSTQKSLKPAKTL